jgi:hypothetical protein
MSIIYETHELRPMVRIAQPNTRFLLNAFFGPIVEFDDEFITFDVMNTKRKLAPFVSPCTAGKPRTNEGFTTKSFKPPYVKPKSHVKPCRAIKRAPGEAIGGGLTTDERYNRALAEELANHANEIDARLEWMAAKCLVDGKFTVTGEDVPEQEIDYGRDSSLSTSSDQWEDPTHDVQSDIEQVSGNILNLIGAGATDIVMDPKAYELFRKNNDVKELLDLRNGGLDMLNIAPEVGARSFYKGLYGSLRLWVYNDVYVDDDDQAQQFIPEYTVLVIANGPQGLEGYQAFGMIQDVESLQPQDIFTKMWPEKDPSGMCVLSQSAGIVIPSRMNAVAYIDVAPAG